MKNYFLRVIAVAIALCLLHSGFSQVPGSSKFHQQKRIQRCGTAEEIAARYQNDPVFRAQQDHRERDYQQYLKTGAVQNGPIPTALTGPVTIPVVVHIVLANPWSITDADIDYFINRLNTDYAGINADSTNCGTFCSLRGHSLLRWTLAKRDVNGNFTTGVERLVGTTTIGTAEPQAIKNAATATGGLAPWDYTKYYNIWVGDGGTSGLLGISPDIGPGTATSDGVCVASVGFSSGCVADAAFNMCRTAVHEIGHNFGLFHTFDQGCTGVDFSQLTSSGCTLPSNLLTGIDDTPPISASTSGCPTVGTTNGCSPAVPKMFQNYMDYTDDACYSMFTKAQVLRLEWVLQNCRAGYLTTLGGQYPANMPALDASAANIIAPGSYDFDLASCSTKNYPLPTCAGVFTPIVRVTNAGTTTLTSITVTTTINGLNPVTQTINTSIATGKSKSLTLNSQTAVPGTNLLTITLSAPKGGTDGNAVNNSISTTFTVAASGGLPYTQDFVSATFPPTGITLGNPDGGTTWVRNATGNGTAGSAYMNCFNYASIGQTDDIKLNAVPTNNGDTVILKFDVSHRPYNATTDADTLAVVYSTDCGSTWTNSSYKKWGPTLGTVAASTTAYTTPTTWRTDSVFIRCNGGNLQAAIRCINGYGNNIFVDNINLYKKTPHVYRFIGNGNWDVAANWSESIIPPAILPTKDQIIIDPIVTGECLLNITQTISAGGNITVNTGKKFRVPGNLVIQ